VWITTFLLHSEILVSYFPGPGPSGALSERTLLLQWNAVFGPSDPNAGGTYEGPGEIFSRSKERSILLDVSEYFGPFPNEGGIARNGGSGREVLVSVRCLIV